MAVISAVFPPIFFLLSIINKLISLYLLIISGIYSLFYDFAIFQLLKSGENTVTLRSAPRNISGKYQCEVSADAPLFHTETKTSHMLVAELPINKPVLTVYSSKNTIGIGELLKANCVSAPSYPPVNFTWTINNNIFPVRAESYRHLSLI